MTQATHSLLFLVPLEVGLDLQTTFLGGLVLVSDLEAF